MSSTKQKTSNKKTRKSADVLESEIENILAEKKKSKRPEKTKKGKKQIAKEVDVDDLDSLSIGEEDLCVMSGEDETKVQSEDEIFEPKKSSKDKKEYSAASKGNGSSSEEESHFVSKKNNSSRMRKGYQSQYLTSPETEHDETFVSRRPNRSPSENRFPTLDPNTPIKDLRVDQILQHLVNIGTETFNQELRYGSINLLNTISGKNRRRRNNGRGSKTNNNYYGSSIHRRHHQYGNQRRDDID